MLSKIRPHFILILGLLFAGLSASAGNNPEYRQTLFGKFGELFVNNSVNTADLNFNAYKNTPGAIEKTYYVKNAVRLMVDEESEHLPQSDFSVTVGLEISATNAAGAVTTFNKTLTLDFKKGQGQISGAITSHEFKDAVEASAKITSFSSNVAWDVTKNLKLVNEIISLRDWGFTCTTLIPNVTTAEVTADEWNIMWDVPANFQTEYDLEWAWVEESAVADYMVNNVVDMNLVFDNNATRVTTSNSNYKVPLLYEDNGRLYARVRMAQQKVNGQRVEGNWYYHSYDGLAYLPRTLGHEDNLNWQATTSYAEDGKRKTILQYYDGTLRGRQMVTKDNTTGTTVVAESFYDHQGRAVIQVLPAPTLNTIIQFTKNFNQFDDTRNAKTVYDKLDVNQSSCNKLTAKMLNTVVGSASQYYSDQNPLAAVDYHKFIPDAAGYPYTETRYTNDGTGRIDAQGGVGPLFQVNSNKETKYFYESADQDDLDALFGTDAGYASHYSKNWVRDANGQYSVSFVDMKGKTIATALAGDAPVNLKALPSFANATKTITRQLVDGETNNVHGNSIISSKSLMVAKAGNFQFNYYLSPEKLKMMLCTGTQFCFDCLYELNISIVPDCSDKVIPGFSNPVIKKNFNLGEYLTSCAGTQSPLLDTIFNVFLEEGAYTVVKELKLSTEARDWYRENVYITNDTCKRKIDFIMQQYSLALSQQNCYVTCAQCTTELGTEADFINRFTLESGLTPAEIAAIMPQIVAAYNEAKENCARICDNDSGESLDEIAAIKDIMMQDMTPPVGQYARRNDSEHPTYETMPYNIFRLTPSVVLCPLVGDVNLKASFRYPVDYYGSAGNTSCAPGYRNAFGIENLSTTVLQASTTTPETFTDDFEDSYANSLLAYHPEFCKLETAEKHLKGTYRFGGRLQNTETFSQAITRGFINPLLTDPGQAADFMMQKDSFFMKVGFGSSYYNEMRNAIISQYVAANTTCGSPNIGMWKLAQLSVFCHKELTENSGPPAGNGCTTPSAAYTTCFNTLSNIPPSSLNHCEADMNMVWKNFRALYISYRNILISNYLSASCSSAYTSIFNPNNGFNYQERFTRLTTAPPYILSNLNGINELLNNPTQGGYQQIAQLEADSICMANTSNWMTRLRQCPQLEAIAINNPAQWTADSTWLSKYLVKICAPGVDYMGHPFGAASLPDGKPAVPITEDPNNVPVSITVRNFPALVSYYLNFRGIAIDAFCYPELIDYPKAYNVAPATVLMPIVTVPEPCACERINYFKTKWQNAGGPGTFSSYLFNFHGTTISQDTLTLLVTMCNTGYTNTNPNCNFLTAPIKLPAIFQCRGTANLDSSKTCISCADFKDIAIAFKAERGVAAIPIVNPQTPAEVALNIAFQHYANYKTGFSKLWPEYVEFSILCANNTDISCTTLNNLLAQWRATNPPDTGDACRNSFVTFMNNATGLNYTFQQWMNEFIKSCGATPPMCEPVVTCDRIKSLINSYYLHYGFQIWRNANCQTLFTNFVNDSLQTNYTYDEIVNKYNYLCGGGCPLNVCSFPNSHLLTLLYNVYKALYPGGGPTMDVCQGNFTNWFNTQLGFLMTPYSWEGIVLLYQSSSVDCVPDINQLCAPTYSCKQLTNILQQFYAAYPGADTMINCQQLFTDFFNQTLGTNYTFQEIAGLYATICHTTLNICQSSTDDWDCKELILLTQTPYICTADYCAFFVMQFNAHFGTNYTYAEIEQIYLQHCKYVLKKCNIEPPVFTCEQLQVTLTKYYTLYPNGAASFGVDCQAFFAGFFNGEHGTNLSYTEISNQYLVLCGKSLEVCNSKCIDYTSFVNTYLTRYENIKISLPGRRQLFAFMFNETFGNASVPSNAVSDVNGARTSASGNRPLIYEEIKILLASCLTMPSTLEEEIFRYRLTDPDVLKDAKTAYYLMHPLGVTADCENDFTAWMNLVFSANETYKQLVDLYETYLGFGTGNICGTRIAGGYGNSGGLTTATLEGRFTAQQYPPMLCGLNVEIFNPPPVDTSTCKDPWLLAISDANVKWELYLDSLRRNFDVAWYNKCIRAKDLESFTVTFQKAEYHYTLYYHDQAGHLVRTVPPEGVDDRRSDAAFLANVKAKRLNVKSGQSEAANILTPNHTLSTEFRYNSLGLIVQQKVPDAGLTKFWYDKIGRLTVSQNAQQALDNKYSYTTYDDLGRKKEIGQKPQTQPMTQDISRNEANLNIWLNNANNKEQIIRTIYDVSYFNGDDLLKPELLYQRNLRNRVSYTQVFDTQPLAGFAGTHRAATYYTYDIHGNVDTLLQDYGNSSYYPNIMNGNGNRYKKMAYSYDLMSGKVNMITYQPGYYNPTTQTWVKNADQFYHRYVYDAENKLTDVYTSHDSLVWERDARYIYYRHGTLARITIGQQQVQGVDYAYTLQGWMKGVNSTAITPAGEESCASGTAKDILDVFTRQQFGAPSIYTARQEVNFHPNFDHASGDDFETIINASLAPCVPIIAPTTYVNGDMGEDGKLNVIGRLTARDAYGFALNYYQLSGGNGIVKDYESINQSYQPFANGVFNLNNSDGNTVAKSFFNGNIASMHVNIPKLGNAQLYGYEYDQLSRLVSMDAFGGFDNTSNIWTNGIPAATSSFKERVSYDANGNILSYVRNGSAQNGGFLAMDNLTYGYNKDINNKLVNNQLRHVKDAVNDLNYQEDIDNQPDDNYGYDANGNLIKDTKEGITNITWNVYNKISSITKSTGTINYTYDVSGNRLSKVVNGRTTWYVRDASGNVMAVYEQRSDLNSNHLTQSEVHLYGSNRLGIMNVNRDMQLAPVGDITSFERGKKVYELSNHLGNVLVTISDRKLGVDAGTYQMQCYPCFPGSVCPPCEYNLVNPALDGIIDYFNADVITANDYYPFGMGMPGRKLNSDKYRYGFNEKENDPETGWQDYGLRIYDPRLGRFLSVDPLALNFPYYSPYHFGGNNPVFFIDLDGAEISKKIANFFGVKIHPVAAGVIDGLLDNLSFISTLRAVWNLATDADYRDEMWESIKYIINDPIGFVKDVAESYKQKFKNIVAWNEEGQYEAGYLIGEVAGSLLSGGIGKMVKMVDDVKGLRKIKRQNFLSQKFGLKRLTSSPCGCFTEETTVLTKDGLKPIAALKDGDLVWAYNDTLKIYELKPIHGHYSLISDTLYTLITATDTIRVTRDHPFLTNRGWVETKDLQMKDLLFTKNNTYTSIASLTKTIEFENVYNFEVTGFHTYIVGRGNVIVHNSIVPGCNIVSGTGSGFYRVVKKKNANGVEEYYIGKGKFDRANQSKKNKTGDNVEWYSAPDSKTAFIYEYLYMQKLKDEGIELKMNLRESPGKKHLESLTPDEQKVIKQKFKESLGNGPTKTN
jgi:RHS repeat-associated protein